MGLSTSQLARMSRLLDEALTLDDAGRRAWLDRLLPEHQDVADVLRKALLPENAADLTFMATSAKLDFNDRASLLAASGMKPGSRTLDDVRRLAEGASAVPSL